MPRKSTSAIIPARLDSSRLPRKVLLEIAGKPMIQHVYERVAAVKLIDKVIVATDSKEIVDVVVAFGGFAVMTDPDHKCGTDRIAEAASYLTSELILNVQADEPMISHKQLIPLIDIAQSEEFEIGTIVTPINSLEEYNDPNTVKAVRGDYGHVMYFSRSPIPFNRDNPNDFSSSLKHLGVYCFAPEILAKVVELPMTPLEEAEKLEQLRWLQNGYKIKSVSVKEKLISVDTEADLERVKSMIS